MSRLDHHVAAVQNKLAFDRFLHALAWTTLVVSILGLGAVLVYEIFQVYPPKPMIWIYSALGAAVLVAIVYAIWRRPSARDAAVAIDDRLGLKEKFSTALFVRTMKDPFANAAVRDAEQTAQSVSLRKKFPLSFPKATYGTATIVAAAFLTFWLMKPLDLFGKEKAKEKIARQEIKKQDAKKVVEQALAQVNSMPKSVADNEAVKLAKADLQKMLQAPVKDPEGTKRSAAKA
nr:hypothetical protein [Chthoniobacterales bacterium]